MDGGAAISDRGHVRPRNEDAVALGRVGPGTADEPGRGGGGRLRRRVVHAVVRTRRTGGRRRRARRPPASRARAGGERAHPLARVDRRRGRGCRARAARHPATPVVHAGLRGARRAGGVLTVGWVGDSRAYWLAEPGAAEPARLLTRGPHRRGRRRGRDAGSGRRRDPPRCHHPVARRGRRRRAGGRRAHPGRPRRAPALHRRALEVPPRRGGARRCRPSRAERSAVPRRPPPPSPRPRWPPAVRTTSPSPSSLSPFRRRSHDSPRAPPHAGFTVQADQNPYLAPGATRVDAVVTVTATGAGGTPADALEIIVVDVSGSMAGEKIRSARQATAAAIAELRDGVAFAVIAGNHRARQVYPDAGTARADERDPRRGQRARRRAQRRRRHRDRHLARWPAPRRPAPGRGPARHPADRRAERRDAAAFARAAAELRGRVHRATAAAWAPTGRSTSCARWPRPCSAPSTSSPGPTTWPPTSAR